MQGVSDNKGLGHPENKPQQHLNPHKSSWGVRITPCHTPINPAAPVQRQQVRACGDQMEAGCGGNGLGPGNLTALLQADGL